MIFFIKQENFKTLKDMYILKFSLICTINLLKNNSKNIIFL